MGMSTEQDDFRRQADDELDMGLIRRFDLFLSNKARPYYFFYGVFLAIIGLWAVFELMVEPAIVGPLERQLVDQRAEIRDLHQELSGAKAEISKLKRRGTLLGSFQFSPGKQEASIIGDYVSVSQVEFDTTFVNFRMHVDPCPSSSPWIVLDPKTGRPCTSRNYWLRVSEGKDGSFELGGRIYSVVCTAATDSFAVIEVYQPNVNIMPPETM